MSKPETKVNTPTPSATPTPTVAPASQKPKTEFDAKVAAALVTKHGSKSGAIRALFASGKTRGEISKILGIRYQHVRNVLITPVKNPKAPVAEPTK